MSSFEQPQFFFLFDMVTDRKKLAYGCNPEDAYAILALRLTTEELALVIKDKFVRIPQRDLQSVSHDLG